MCHTFLNLNLWYFHFSFGLCTQVQFKMFFILWVEVKKNGKPLFRVEMILVSG